MQLSGNPGSALKEPQIYELAVRYILLQEVNVYVCCRILFYQCRFMQEKDSVLIC